MLLPPVKMIRLSLVPLLLLSPNSCSQGSAVLANGFTSSTSLTSRRPSLTSSSFQKQQNAFFLRCGGMSQFSSSSLTATSTSVEADVGPALEVISQSNWDLLSDRGKAALSRLILYDLTSGHHGQKHVYGDWPEAGVEDEGKKMLAEQVRWCVVLSCTHHVIAKEQSVIINS